MSGIGLFNKGRKYTALSARQVFAQDKRKPVVYLRSFKDDFSTSQTQNVYDWKTHEEEVANVMRQIGPFVAVGNPREQLPELGAARMYLGDHEWQRTVSILSSHAQLVVLRAGNTPGLWWEVQMVSKMVKPEHLVFLIPCAKKQYDEFRQNANRYFPRPLPEFVGSGNSLLNLLAGDDGSFLKGIVYFEKDWTTHFVPLERKQSGWNVIDARRSAAFRSLTNALRPVFNQLQIPLAPVTPPLLTRLVNYFVVTVLVFALLAVSCYVSAMISSP
ncbi:MAG: hypothetical protein QM730_19450 [Anaerolineales bacterium]